VSNVRDQTLLNVALQLYSRHKKATLSSSQSVFFRGASFVSKTF